MSLNGRIVTRSRMKLKDEFCTLSSHRSEAFGVLGAILMYTKLQEFTSHLVGARPRTTVTVYCDNESLVNTVNEQGWKKFTPQFNYTPDADLIREIILQIRFIRRNNETIRIQHIKGHQDRTGGALTYAAHLNITADHLATDSLLLSAQNKELELPHKQVSIYINDKMVTSNYTKHLSEAFVSEPARKHIENINGWRHNEFNLVWWEPVGKAIEKYSGNPQLMLQKYINNRLPTNKRESKYYKYIEEGCHLCQQLETQDHILQCRYCEKRCTNRAQFIIDLKSFLQQSYLEADSIRVITNCTQAYLQGDDTPTALQLGIVNNTTLLRAFEEQSAIGWNNWFRGRITKKWGEVYTNSVRSTIGNAYNGPRILPPEAWAIKLICKLWDHVRQAWQLRNGGEHGTNDDPLRTQKEKLVKKILWQKTKVTYFPNNYLRNLTEESLRGLPLENLKMTDSQFQILIRASTTGQNREENV
jgi:hypothetical protein